jgi:hypothetical protein
MRLKLACFGIAIAAAAALAACGKPPSAAAPGAAAAHADAPAWVRDQWNSLPDWNMVANIADGGRASFSPRSIKRDAASGATQVEVQILHAAPIPYREENAAIVQTTWYFKERAIYRFNCAARTYVVLKRDYLGAGDAVIGSDHADPESAADSRPIGGSGLAVVLEGPVCKAA